MKTWLIWVIGIALAAVIGVVLGVVLEIGTFGWVIGAFVGVLVIIMMFKAKVNAENKEVKVYDEY
ncbi:MAG: hypothetical protein IJD90_04455 [Clostridia bacterium]|nr:hypothetical protein [Clostridia bacterium]